jgi:hypothetical protein
LKWNWDPAGWKKSTKVLLGIATIWPTVYLCLFILFMFSMFLFMPFSGDRSPSCGDLDVLQLDRKIKNGEIKELSVRPSEIVAVVRDGNCEFRVSVRSDSTRDEILKTARELVNGQPRVARIEEEPDQEVPSLVPLGFVGLFAAHMLTILLSLALLPFYVIFVVKSDRLDQTNRIIWVILICMLGMLTMPVYWYMYIWRNPLPFTSSAKPPSSV